jgi:haloalkane dehalogenase
MLCQKPPMAAELLHPEYPFVSRWLEVTGGWRLHYVEEGSGPPVLFLHGNPTWSFYFRRALAHLGRSFRCIAPDHIGCGLSDQPSPRQYEYSLRRRIEDVEALVEHVAPGQAIALVVHDWGGPIGLGWAARHPERLAALVAMNTAAFPKPATHRLPRSLWLARHTGLGAFLVRRMNWFCQLAARWCVVRRPLPSDVRRMYLLPYRSAAQRWAVLKFVQTIPLRPGDAGFDILQHIVTCFPRWQHVPTLLVWGLADFVFDRTVLEAWQQYLPQAQVRAWPDAGHYLLEDAPEEVLPVLEEFLLRYYQSPS